MSKQLTDNSQQLTVNGKSITIPGLASVHSHAFQRGIRGRTQRQSGTAGSFWSWRGLMYQLVERLDPEMMYAIAKLAYAEMALSGITLVGEFHYVHHDKNGHPYANRTEMAEAVIRAATDVGLRISLLRTGYMRAGFQQTLAPGQTRFIDPDVDLILHDIDTLQSRYKDDPLVTIGVAAHSIRGMEIGPIAHLNDYANENDLPFHIHVCEQRRELDECMAEYGVTPVELLDHHGILGPRFVGIHATHLNQNELKGLGNANSFVNVCRTTERDLGDGLPLISDMLAAGVRLCVGIDSHCCENGFEEIRALENDERSRLEGRTIVGNADFLLDVGTAQGYAAVGLIQNRELDYALLDKHHISLLGLPDERLIDGIIYNGSPDLVQTVVINGKTVVENGELEGLVEIKRGFVKALEQVFA